MRYNDRTMSPINNIQFNGFGIFAEVVQLSQQSVENIFIPPQKNYIPS